MKGRIVLFAAAILWFVQVAAVAQQRPAVAPERLVVNVDTRQTAAPVSKYEFGMFIEHIGTLIYRSLWSEMLDDRKFYFSIVSKDPEPVAPVRPGPGRTPLRKWRPVGPDEAPSRSPRFWLCPARLSMPTLAISPGR